MKLNSARNVSVLTYFISPLWLSVVSLISDDAIITLFNFYRLSVFKILCYQFLIVAILLIVETKKRKNSDSKFLQFIYWRH